jgi:LPS export ABC transporter protein LptC
MTNKTIAKQKSSSVCASRIAIFSLLFSLCYFLFSLSGCTFDYGGGESSGSDQPDLIMENVEYVRVRSADPIARFQAERAERYEKQGVMKLQNFIFEQYGERGEEVNALGKAGYASVDINTSDIFMDNGVRIEVDAEDIIIETNQLEWRDEPRTLSTGEGDEVIISQENGTSFTGIGLRADARRRTWEFVGNVGGTYIYEDEEETELTVEFDEFEYTEDE